MQDDELPVQTATSLILEGFKEVDRNKIAKKILQVFEKHFSLWESQGSAPFISDYEKICSSLHEKIQITLPDGESMKAVATGISPLGELVLSDGTLINSADILHLR
jgi:BirA family biotin operon repressor/biotin-[acetyl-CoA-carboxylase] ligase